MIVTQISDWRLYKRDGEQFLKTAAAAHKRSKQGFSPEAHYNIACMAIEKLIMAFLMKNGDLAENHTMTDLVRSLEKHLELPHHLKEQLLFLDTYQEICALDDFTIKKVTPQDISTFIATATLLHTLLTPHFDG